MLWRNESNLTFPTASTEIFAARAMILGAESNLLPRRLDLPWCRADEYYAQKLALALNNLASIAWN